MNLSRKKLDFRQFRVPNIRERERERVGVCAYFSNFKSFLQTLFCSNTRFCSHEAPAPLLSTGNTLYVTFKTDSYVQRTGFHASYDFIFPAKEVTTSTTTPPPVYIDHSDDERLDRLGANFIEPQLKFPEAEVNITWDNKDLKFGALALCVMMLL